VASRYRALSISTATLPKLPAISTQAASKASPIAFKASETNTKASVAGWGHAVQPLGMSGF